MTEEVFNLDRENNIEALVDALGKKWVIKANKQNGLCYARPHPDRTDAVIPETLQGLWTKPSILKPKIVEYVTKTWVKADKAKAAAERAKQAKAEQAKKVAAERAKQAKVENDKRKKTK